MASRSTKEIYDAEGTQTVLLMDPRKVYIVGLDKDAPDVPELEDKERIDAPSDGLIQSMRTHGFRGGAITVRRVADKVVAVDGRQRLMAARKVVEEQVKAGSDMLLRVKCLIDDATNLQGAMGTMFVANEHRRELSPLQKARGAARMAANGYEGKDIQATFGVSRQTLHNWKKVLTLPENILALVELGTLPMTTAMTLADIPADKQQEALAEALREASSSDGDGEDGEGGDAPKGEVRRRIAKKAAGEDTADVAMPWNLKCIKELQDLTDPAQNEADDEEDAESDETQLMVERAVWAVCSMMLGDNKSGSRLNDFPRLKKWARSCAPRPKAKAEKADKKGAK